MGGTLIKLKEFQESFTKNEKKKMEVIMQYERAISSF